MENNQDYKQIVAKNIAGFRKANGLTQAELAEQLNYSDKSISKWERGDGFPDIFTLKELSVFFGVSVDDFFKEDVKIKKRKARKNKILVPLLSCALAWLVVSILFAISIIFFSKQMHDTWLIFIYGIPVTGIILTVFFAIYHKNLFLFISESLIIWGVGLSLFLSIVVLTHKYQGMWLIFVVCAGVEILAFLYYLLIDEKIHFNWFKKKKKEQ